MSEQTFCIFDTEGSGLFDYKRPADDHDQPRLAEIAMVMTDAELNILDRFHSYVTPIEWEMSDGATEANGITTELLMEHGRPIAEVLDAYTQVLDAGLTLVAFNAQHDMKQMRAELRRAKMPDRFEESPNICVMRALGPVCRLPRASGAGWKWPKLTEALKHFAIPYKGPLGAIRDADACLALFAKAIEVGACPQAEVHYAKQYPLPLKEAP